MSMQQRDGNGAARVRVIFAYHTPDIVQTRPDWPNVGYDFAPAMKGMIDALESQIPDVEFVPTSCADDESAKEIVLEDEKTGEIDGYLVVQLNCWNKCILGVREATRKATLYTALPYGGDGGWLKYNATMLNRHEANYASLAAFDFSKVVEMAKAFEALRDGTAEDFQKKALELRSSIVPPDTAPAGLGAIDDKVACLSPEATLAKLKGMKILSVEWEPDDPFADEVLRTLGIVIERVSFDELNGAACAADDAEVRAVAESWAGKAERIECVTDETLRSSARLYLAMKRTMAAHGANAVTVDCLSGCYSGRLCAYPCLGFMQLQDDGLMGVCENDWRATITMLVFSALSGGRIGYVSDPALDMPSRSIIYAHCVSTRRFFGADGPEAPYEILTHSEDRKGASVRAFAPIGEPVTTVLLEPSRRAITLHTGVVTANDRDDRACRTKIVARVTGDYSRIELTWDRFNWHRVTFLGDMKAGVEAFAKKIGYEVVHES